MAGPEEEVTVSLAGLGDGSRRTLSLAASLRNPVKAIHEESGIEAAAKEKGKVSMGRWRSRRREKKREGEGKG